MVKLPYSKYGVCRFESGSGYGPVAQLESERRATNAKGGGSSPSGIANTLAYPNRQRE